MKSRSSYESPTERILSQIGSLHITSQYSSSEFTFSSRDTSDISVEPTEHCKDRQKERVVSHKEIQHILKHGLRTRDPGGNKQRQKCEFEGIVVIVAGRKRVVTAWRTASKKNIIVPSLPPRLKTMLPKQPVLPPIIEVEEDEYVWDPNYYGGWVHKDDPSDYSEQDDRYYAWKNGLGDIEWVQTGVW